MTAMALPELLAVLLAIAYLLLAIRQNIYCWLAAATSAAIYLFLMYQAGLYMESALQLFYIAMAGYGWVQWRQGAAGRNELQINSWPPVFNLLPIATILCLTLISGALLDSTTEAAFPYLDSFTTWGALVATWMVARKILQNWHYWFVIDSVSVYLFISRELWLTACLFVAYLILIVVGYRTWRRDWIRRL